MYRLLKRGDNVLLFPGGVSEALHKKCAQLKIVGEGGREGGGGAGGIIVVLHGRSLSDRRPSHPYNEGAEHVGFPPSRQTLLAINAKCREVSASRIKGGGDIWMTLKL